MKLLILSVKFIYKHFVKRIIRDVVKTKVFFRSLQFFCIELGGLTDKKIPINVKKIISTVTFALILNIKSWWNEKKKHWLN